MRNNIRKGVIVLILRLKVQLLLITYIFILTLIDESHLPLYDSQKDWQNSENEPQDPPEVSMEQHPPVTNNNQNLATDGLIKQLHRNESKFSEGTGKNLLQRMEDDALFAERRESGNVFFPFYSHMEWQLVDWFGKTLLSQAQINSFLRLDFVSLFPLPLHQWLTLYSIKKAVLPSHLHKMYEIGLNNSLRCLSGNTKLSLFHRTSPVNQWSYTGKTVSRSFKACFQILSLQTPWITPLLTE